MFLHICILSLENTKKEDGLRCSRMCHTHGFWLHFVLYTMRTTQYNSAFSLTFTKKIGFQKTSCISFPLSTAKPAVNDVQYIYKAEEGGETRRKEKWHPCAPSGKFHYCLGHLRFMSASLGCVSDPCSQPAHPSLSASEEWMEQKQVFYRILSDKLQHLQFLKNIQMSKEKPKEMRLFINSLWSEQEIKNVASGK